MLRVVLLAVSVIEFGNGVEFNNPLALRNSEFFNDVADFYTLRSAAIVNPQCRKHCDIYRQALLDREIWALSSKYLPEIQVNYGKMCPYSPLPCQARNTPIQIFFKNFEVRAPFAILAAPSELPPETQVCSSYRITKVI